VWTQDDAVAAGHSVEVGLWPALEGQLLDMVRAGSAAWRAGNGSTELGGGWAALMEVAEAGDRIRVAEPSRLTRNPAESAIMLRALQQHAVAVEELSEEA
jgi:hypothetical protein